MYTPQVKSSCTLHEITKFLRFVKIAANSCHFQFPLQQSPEFIPNVLPENWKQFLRQMTERNYQQYNRPNENGLWASIPFSVLWLRSNELLGENRILADLFINLFKRRWTYMTYLKLMSSAAVIFTSFTGPVCPKSRALPGPEKPVVKLQSACLLTCFQCKNNREGGAVWWLRTWPCEGRKGIVATEIGPDSFGTYEKQTLGSSYPMKSGDGYSREMQKPLQPPQTADLNRTWYMFLHDFLFACYT